MMHTIGVGVFVLVESADWETRWESRGIAGVEPVGRLQGSITLTNEIFSSFRSAPTTGGGSARECPREWPNRSEPYNSVHVAECGDNCAQVR